MILAYAALRRPRFSKARWTCSSTALRFLQRVGRAGHLRHVLPT